MAANPLLSGNMTPTLYDDASNGVASHLQRLKLAREAAVLITERGNLSKEIKDVIRALQIGKRLREIALQLGLRAPAPVAAAIPEPTTAATVRTEPAAEFYPDEGKRTLAQRQKDNDAAIALLRRVQAGEVQVTDAERVVLAKYSGNGGGLTGADGLTGSPHEYYTPKPIATAMWALLGDLGFTGGTVLDPSAGSGIFTATRPQSAVMTQVELDETSGTINGLINDGPTVKTTVSPFEAIAASTPDESYDAIITNVPFGDLAMRGDNARKDKRFQKRNLQEYFVLRSLQKLKPGGLAAFIVPPSIVGGKGSKAEKLRRDASLMAEFVGAYRLPNKVFTESAAADTITDVVVFRKFSRDAAQKIDELLEQNPGVLTEANVLWSEFLEGRYFQGAGLKFVLGETERGIGKFGEVDKVVNDDSLSNIAALIRKFPGSHIDWDKLNAAETTPIVYAEGDVIHSNGQTLQWTDGAWKAVESTQVEDRAMVELGPKLQIPLDAVNAGVTWDMAARWMDYQAMKGNYADMPAWLVAAHKTIPEAKGDAQGWWEAITAGMAAMQLMQGASVSQPFNYRDGYPLLSAQLARVQAYGNKTIGKAPRLIKDALLSIRNARTGGEFTPFWLGEIRTAMEAAVLTPTQLYEKVRYQEQDETGYVAVAKLREAFSEFDPLTADEWCLSGDGLSVMHASDYYSGTYAEFTAAAQRELDAATDPAVRAKLARQMDLAKLRLNTVDVSKMTFSLFSPHVGNLQKLEFFKAYVSPHIFLTTDNYGREVFDIKQPALRKYANSEEIAQYKALQRFVKGYLRNQNITTMSKVEDVEGDPAREAALLRRIKEITDKTKAQFDAWARANEEIQTTLHNKLNAPEALRFIEEPDGTPLDIPNLNTTTFRPHAYQYGAARRYARKYAGVLGFDVGLGKTLTALATTQYVQSIGVKKKTIFVVPNATLTNWKKEAGKAYLSTSDCLFVGVVQGKNGKDRVDNNQVKADLNVIRENRHSKIFMTLEAFKLIPLREETMEAYIAHLAETDDAYLLSEDDAKKKRANIASDAKNARVREVGEKSGAIPYFEDMGVDSLVLDEGHNYKNSKTTSSEFKGAKYLADPAKSQRGMDMQAKAWYVRGLTARNDGVLVLTATPVTNSPLEVYSMLTLALGEREVNAMYGVTGADSFMAAACDIEEREEENIVGIMRPVRVFTGLANAGLLRRLVQSSCLIKTAEDVKADGIDIAVPEADEIATGVDIGAQSYAKIIAYKDEYLKAVASVKAGSADADDKLTASPFNLIRKMTRVINDPELDRGVFVFKHTAAQAGAAAKAVAAFNAKNVVEERDYVDPHAAKADVKLRATKDTETGESVMKYLVTVRARAVDGAVELLSVDYQTQDTLLKLLAAQGIEPTVNISPKLAALIDNYKQERAAPRHMGRAKQLIFCDELSLHHKIKLALVQLTGTPAAKIKVVNAVAVDVAGMQDVQDGFNADGEDNRYEAVILNKKGEVGINLQKGTQAIHHLTIGWTPDSIHQRNGRGVRQGNPLERVNVYHYDADGTFDAYKRNLVGVKADWIGALMSGDSAKVVIEGDMSGEDYEMLANAVGDATAMQRINEEIAARNRRQRQAASRTAQLQSARIIDNQRAWLERFGAEIRGGEHRGFTAWLMGKRSAIRETRQALRSIGIRLDVTSSEAQRKRLQAQAAELGEKLAGQLAAVAGATDDKGEIADRNEYTQITDAERNGAVYASWQKDVRMAVRMREEAAASFANRSDEGYSTAVLESFMAGKAKIIAGQLVTAGSFVEFEGKLMVALDEGGVLTGLYPADAYEKRKPLELMTNAAFTVPGSPNWSATVARAVALDVATIKASSAGFAPHAGSLYASWVADVRDGLPVAIPGAMVRADTIRLKAPHYPYIVSTDEGGPLVARVKAEQAALVEEVDRWGNVRLKDMRLVDGSPNNDTTEDKYNKVRAYCVAHKIRATGEDTPAFGERGGSMSAVVQGLKLHTAFFNALPSGVAACKSPEELEAWALRWLNDAQDWLQIDSLEQALGYDVREFRRSAAKLDDGRERWALVPEEVHYQVRPKAIAAVRAAIEGGLLVDEIMGAAAASAYSSYMPREMNDHGEQLARVLFKDTGDFIELTVGVEEARAAMHATQSTRLYLESWDDAGWWTLQLMRSEWVNMKAWAKQAQAKRNAAELGVDIDAILAKLRAIDGVWSVELGDSDETKYPDRYSQLYAYKANQYVRIKTTRGTRTHEKIATAGAAGLEGRTFDNVRKAFRLTLKDGEKFSDGKPVASVNSLLAHLGIE
ncbi:SNF2-related protein [Cupriavidus pauculus]|uniref:SNF2-related protein n=1 Tax=Cupriavidus pauculus TaxID=82633 RepID=UPI001D0C094F